MLKVLSDHPMETVPVRLGISISKKVSKKAVVRNRIKRQLRSLLRELLPQMSPGSWIVILVRQMLPSAITSIFCEN
jgi:ribonuclease P protein component